MQNITTRIDALGELINDLMLYAQPQPLQLGPMNLRALINEATAFLRRDVTLQAVEITVEKDDYPLLTNGELLRAAMLNLLLNATQAMSKHGRITITLRRTAAEAEIEVRDTGP